MNFRNWIWPRSRRAMTTYLVLGALFVALSVVLTRFFSVQLFGNALRLSIGMVPIFVAGLLLGPIYGGAVGIAADVLGQLIRSMGAPHPGILLNAALYGVIPGLFVLTYRRLDRPVLVQAVLVATVLLSALLQTYWVTHFTSLPFGVQFVQRLPGVLFNGGALFVLVLLLFPQIERLERRLFRLVDSHNG